MMERKDLNELHYITHIANVASILSYGILSHNRAKKLNHKSIADQTIQDLRVKKVIPGDGLLHDHVNLYFCARNPMMYVRRNQHESLCVLSLKTSLLDLEDVKISDGNAAAKSEYTAFYKSPDGLRSLDYELIFARDWNDNNPAKKFFKRSKKCAEILIPNRVDPSFIRGAYVSNRLTQRKLKSLNPGLKVEISSDLFFQMRCRDG
jgi:hypothetical protein